MKGKSADGFAPLGPDLVTADEIPNVQAMKMALSVNGKAMQTGSTANMVFPVAHLIAYTSHFMTLLPGDVISTGTPAGVGMGRKPPRYLKPGDVVEATIEGLGTQRQRVSTTRREETRPSGRSRSCFWRPASWFAGDSAAVVVGEGILLSGKK
jgi:2,4-didehydro-3-deoxy-L-rhamnonate hydrolase